VSIEAACSAISESCTRSRTTIEFLRANLLLFPFLTCCPVIEYDGDGATTFCSDSNTNRTFLLLSVVVVDDDANDDNVDIEEAVVDSDAVDRHVVIAAMDLSFSDSSASLLRRASHWSSVGSSKSKPKDVSLVLLFSLLLLLLSWLLSTRPVLLVGISDSEDGRE